MKIPTELVVASIVGLMIYLYRDLFTALYKNSLLGRLLSVLLIVAITFKKTEYGILAAIVYIIVDKTVVEGMSNNDAKQSDTKNENIDTNDAVASFKNKHCKDGKIIDKDGNPIDIKDLSSNFPEISFNLENSATCNPCAEKCNFKLTSSDERISVEEKMRPVDSAEVSTS
jgi:hypothetical protein